MLIKTFFSIEKITKQYKNFQTITGPENTLLFTKTLKLFLKSRNTVTQNWSIQIIFASTCTYRGTYSYMLTSEIYLFIYLYIVL